MYSSEFGPFICAFSQVFPDVSNDSDGQDLRDMEGPTVRERMEQERAARMAEGASLA